jgi:hypothetical protein
MGHLFGSRAVGVVAACLAVGALAGPELAGAAPPVAQRPSGANAAVSCKRLHHGHLRCSMTIKDGGGLSGTVTMRITRGKLVVAVGRGRIANGTAALTMRVLHRMTPGRYTVAMVLTLNARKEVSLR